jgi:hypothetical protein
MGSPFMRAAILADETSGGENKLSGARRKNLNYLCVCGPCMRSLEFERRHLEFERLEAYCSARGDDNENTARGKVPPQGGPAAIRNGAASRTRPSGSAERMGRLPLPSGADDYGANLLVMKGSVAHDVNL